MMWRLPNGCCGPRYIRAEVNATHFHIQARIPAAVHSSLGLSSGFMDVRDSAAVCASTTQGVSGDHAWPVGAASMSRHSGLVPDMPC